MLRIPFPAPFRFIEFTGIILHRFIINRFDLCLVPDFPGDKNLSGRLSHIKHLPEKVLFSGPLSRFETNTGEAVGLQHQKPYVCLILSGPEPQRTILLERIMSAAGKNGKHLVVLTGSESENRTLKNNDFELIINPSAGAMRYYISNSETVICRSGYTTIMELFLMKKGAVIIPTPGQTEQEYLGKRLNGRYGFYSLRQSQITRSDLVFDQQYVSEDDRHFPEDLLKKALDRILEEEHKRKHH